MCFTKNGAHLAHSCLPLCCCNVPRSTCAQATAWLCDPLLLGFSCWWELLQLCWWLLPSAGCPSCLTPVRPCRWSGGSFPWLVACLRYLNTQAPSDKPQLTTPSYIYIKTFVLLVMGERSEGCSLQTISRMTFQEVSGQIIYPDRSRRSLKAYVD